MKCWLQRKQKGDKFVKLIEKNGDYDQPQINFYTLVNNSTDKKYYNQYNNKYNKYYL